MSHLDILLPFSLPPAPLSGDLLKELNHLPAFATLTSRTTFIRAQPRREEFEGFHRALPHEIWLSRRFGLEKALQQSGSPPIAPALMQTFGLKVETGLWFVLQPVHIHIARDHLVLTDPRQLMLSEQQARVLFNIAKPLFEEVNLDLIYGNPDIWFVRADAWAGLQTSTPDAASGHNIDIWMPKGPMERNWRKIQNEVQMHWFNHSINEEREANRLKPVNSLWIWGGAFTGTEQTDVRPPVGFNFSGWPQAFQQYMPQHKNAANPDELFTPESENGLLLLDTLLEPALSEDWGSWLNRMQQLETDWIVPLMKALKQGKLDSLSLILTHDSRLLQLTTTRSSLKKFWIKPTLAALRT